MAETTFKEKATKAILEEKKRTFNTQKYYSSFNNGVYLTPVTFDACNDEIIELLTKWRSDNQEGFTKIFDVTIQGTRTWMDAALLQRNDRLLFLVYDRYGKLIGHLGVSSFDYNKETCEIDNVVRGEISQQKDVMFCASQILIDWVKDVINPRETCLRVLNNNVKALSLYHRLGFVPYDLEGLKKVEDGDMVEWVPVMNGMIDRFFVQMSLKGK